MSRNPYHEARLFIASEFDLETTAHFDDARIRRMIDQLWTAGWPGFLRDNGFNSGHVYLDTDLAKISLIVNTVDTSFRIGLLDKIVRFEVTDDCIKLTIRCHEVKTWYSRIRVTAQGLRRYIWDYKNGHWSMREDFPETVWNPKHKEYDVLGQYSKLRDPLRAMEDDWQWEWCYRPGTPKSPMDGPWRRDE